MSKKRIAFLRHAKSDWKTGVQDFNRPLNKRGERDAPEMGRRLKKIGFRPDYILLSSSNRTRQTIALLKPAAGLEDIEQGEFRNLYLGDESDYTNLIDNLNDSLDTILICGHNPTISEMIYAYSHESVGDVPTCAIAIIEFDVNQWKEISFGTGFLIHFDYPKNS